MKDICCIGHVTLDKIITPKKTTYMNGGTSFYFAYAINQLPRKVSFQLITSTSEEDACAVSRMQKRGIDAINHISKHTVIFENKYGEDMNNRTQRVLDKAEPFTIEMVKDVEAKVFHLGTLLSDDFPNEVVEYLANKGKLSIDVQGYLREVRNKVVYPVDWKDKLRILQCTEILKVNEHEMEVVSGLKDPHEAAKCLASWGVHEVIITLGSYGSLIYAGDKFYEIPAYEPKKVVDATGCGDTYSTGYLYTRALGADYDEAGRFAAAMCTIKLEHHGAFSGTIEDVYKIIK